MPVARLGNACLLMTFWGFAAAMVAVCEGISSAVTGEKTRPANNRLSSEEPK